MLCFLLLLGSVHANFAVWERDFDNFPFYIAYDAVVRSLPSIAQERARPYLVYKELLRIKPYHDDETGASSSSEYMYPVTAEEVSGKPRSFRAVSGSYERDADPKVYLRFENRVELKNLLKQDCDRERLRASLAELSFSLYQEDVDGFKAAFLAISTSSSSRSEDIESLFYTYPSNEDILLNSTKTTSFLLRLRTFTGASTEGLPPRDSDFLLYDSVLDVLFDYHRTDRGPGLVSGFALRPLHSYGRAYEDRFHQTWFSREKISRCQVSSVVEIGIGSVVESNPGGPMIDARIGANSRVRFDKTSQFII